MWWILDLIVVSIIVFYVYLSAKRGFVRTVIELIGYFLAIFLATTLSSPVSNFVYDSFISPGIVEDVTGETNLTTDSSDEDKINQIWNSLPDIVVKNEEKADLSKDTLRDTINKTDSGLPVDSLAKSATDATVKPIILPIIKAIATVLLFIILMFVVKILAKVINKVFNLPLIGKLNRFLGGIIGLLKGVIFATIFVMLIVFFVSVSENGFLFFNYENIDRSIIFKFLMGFTPFK